MKHLIKTMAFTLLGLVLSMNMMAASPATGDWDLTSSKDDWSATGNEAYFSQPYGYKKANGTLTNANVADFTNCAKDGKTITSIKVGFKGLRNGTTASKITISLVDKDGNILTSGSELELVNKSSASNTAYVYSTFTTGFTGATGFMMKVTTFGKNVLINGASYEITYEEGDTPSPIEPEGSSYTITFATGSGDGTSASTSTACSTVVSDGSDYLSGNLATATKVYYSGGSGLKLGASSNAGTIKMNLSTAGQVTPTSIVVNAKLYNSDKATTLKVNGSATQNLAADFADYTFNITSKITYIELETSKYAWIKSVTVNYEAADPTQPSLSVSPEEIDFGTVDQNAAIPTGQDVEVTFANLTTNDVTASISGDFNINKTGSFTSGDKIMVTPKSTATIGTIEGTLTVKATTDDITKTVPITMIVAAPEVGVSFEKATSAYTDWEFTNFASQQTHSDVKAHTGAYFGTTGGKESGSMVTKAKIAKPGTLQFFISKQSTNTSASSWKVSVSSDNSEWTQVGEAIDATSMTKGTWTEVNVDLTAYSNVYVKLEYAGSTATRCIDDVVFIAPQSYDVTLATSPASVGTVTAKVNNVEIGAQVEEGQTVTLTATPNDAHAYRFKEWQSDDVTITDNAFEMPGKAVAITAVFEPVYAVSVTTAGEGSGTATINGSTETIYVGENDEITLVAENATGSEFGGWTATDNIVIDKEGDAETFAYASSAGTITATFNKKQCTILDTPQNIQVADKTYSGAKLTWDAVGNADYYMVFIPTVDIEEIVEGTQFEATGLSAKTQYTYQVIASSNSDTYCDSNPAEGNFTTADYPAATLTLSENGDTRDVTGLKVNTPFNLPNCSVECDKEFVGWSESNTDHSNLLAAGSPYTMTETTGTLYAWFATEIPGETTDVYTLKISKNTSNSAYASYYDITYMEIGWKIPGNQNIGAYVKLGGKLSAATDRYLYSKTAITSKVNRVIANHGTKDAEITVNSVTLDVYSTAAKASTGGAGDISSVSGTYTASGNTTFECPSNADWTGRFYRLTYNLSSSDAGNNKGLILNSIKMQSNATPTYSDYSTTCSAKAKAPVFDLAEGTYTEAKELNISAEDGATIYYTLDGTNPDNTKTLYEGAISLNTYGEVTIKAMAVVTGKDPSDVVTKTYMINLPFASLADLVAATEANKIPNNNATVTVTLSNIEIASFNGTKGVNLNVICENKNVQIYNSTAFDTKWKVGGTLSHSSLTCTWSRFVQNSDFKCWELMPTNWDGFTYNDPAHITSIAISGEPTNKDYSDGQQLNPAGLVVTGTYSDSPEHTEVITEGLTWTLPTLAEGATTAKVTVKYTEPILSTPLTSEEYEVTINAVTPAKTLQSIYVADDSEHKTEFFVGRPFSAEGLKVMAKYNIGEDQAIIPTSVTPPTMTSEGTKQVTVSYTEGGVTADAVTYDITLTYMNLNDLVAATDIEKDDYVYVSFENVKINGFYTNSSGKRYGIYLDVQKSSKDIEIYCNSAEHDATWKQYGTVSATFDNVKWTEYNGTWELTPSSWENVTYTAPNIPVTSMEISPAEVSVGETKTATLSIVYTPEHATNTGVTWAVTEGSEYASVDEEGVVTGILAGTATITATLKADENITATRTVTVTETPKCTISYYVKGEVASTQQIAREEEGTLTYEPTLVVAGYTFAGWAEAAIAEETATATLISTYTPGADEATKNVYAVFKRVDDSSPTYQQYAKVTSALTDWAGDYLIAYSDEIFANGQVGGTDGMGKQYNTVKPEGALSNNVVTKEWGDQYKVTLEEISAGSNTYVLKTQDGKYNYQTSNANGLNATSTKSTAAQYPITVTFTSANDVKLGLGGGATGAVFRYNTDQYFRYYKDGGQKAVYLYKYDAGTALYTSNPVAKVKVTFNLDGGVGGCGTITVDAGDDVTLCEDAPTKDLYKFDAWSDGENEYAPSATIENVTEDIELKALWIAKQQYTISFNKAGAAGTTPTSITDYEYNEVTLPVQGDLSNPGYIFGGWKYGEITYAGGASFTMPENNVSMTAVWVAKTNDKWVLVTSADQLTPGKQYAIVSNEKEAAMGAMVSGKTYMANVSASFNADKSMMIAIDPSAVILTLGGNATDGWTLSNNNQFLGSETNKNMKWSATADDYCKWAITIADAEDDYAADIFMSETIGSLLYNSNNNSQRFTTYASDMTAVQLYVLVPAQVIDDEVNASTLDDHADVTVNEGGNLLVTEGNIELGDIYVMAGGKVTIEGTATLTVTNFVIKSTMACGQSGQVIGVTSTNFTIEGSAYFDVTLGDNGNPEKWHAFAVPFNVDAINGIYDLDDNKLTNEVNYAIMDYHGDVRAQGQYGWKKFRGIMQPGVFYLMTVDGERTTYRMKMNGGFQASSTTITVNEYASGTDADAGWNGIANNQLGYSSLGVNVQVLNPTTYTYKVMTASTYNFTVGTPFFYQANGEEEDGKITLAAANSDNPAYAPRMTAEAKNIAVTLGNDNYTDRLYISATDEATNEYQIGRDLAKMTMTNAPAVPQIFAEAYGTKLCMVDAPMMYDEAVYALNLYAPANGEYTMGAAQVEGYEVFLTQNGSVIWNLSMSEATIELTKGNNTEYGLILKATSGHAPTDINTLNGQESVQKFLYNSNIYIRHNNQTFNVQGQLVK